MDYTTLKGEPSGTLRGLTLSREFGEFTWGFNLNEWYPRGQYNGSIAVHEAGSPGAFWRLYHEPNLRKFIEPTVYGVHFPNVCRSQAWYDAGRRMLIMSMDAGLPRASGSATSLGVQNIRSDVRVLIDDQPSERWVIVNGELEITTTVGEHTILISH